MPESLKASTRVKRGKGVRRKVSSSSDLPSSWPDFLHVDQNKTELFQFLSNRISSASFVDRQVFVTDGPMVLSNKSQELITLPSYCSHEEADTRLLLHVFDAAGAGFSKVMIRTVDTDVVVIAIACFSRLAVEELWVWFGTGSHVRYVPVHELAVSLKPDHCLALPFFHAFTGCDTVSAFAGHGKKTAWETWLAFPDVTSVFVQLSSQPKDIDACMPLLERYTVLLYDRTSNKMTVNEARKQLFAKKGRRMEDLPPTQAALVQHAKRAAIQSGYCWFAALEANPQLPCPSDWGWVKATESDTDGDGVWQPLWSTLSDVAHCCPELVKCGCKKGCALCKPM